MSHFTNAITHIDKWRESREASLNNQVKQRWFTSDAPDMNSLVFGVFGSSIENAAWEKVVEDTPVISKIVAARIRVNILANIRRTLRSLFTVGVDNAIKTELDIDRHAMGINRAARYKDKMVNTDLAVKDGGTAQ